MTAADIFLALKTVFPYPAHTTKRSRRRNTGSESGSCRCRYDEGQA